MAALASRIVSAFLTTLLVIGVMAPSASAGSLENEALALLNAERVAAGLAPVAMHSDLVDDALAWTLHMQNQGSLSHNPSLSSVAPNWDELGENVGVGTSISALHTAFMNSSGHRSNILGDYDSVGIAVVAETSSKFWITVVFMKSLNPAPVNPSGDDPEPYAETNPSVGNGQPVATRAMERAPGGASSPAPEPRENVVFVQAGATPIAD